MMLLDSEKQTEVRNLHVVLIQPAEPFGQMAEIPVSIIGLASILQQAEITVEILDARLDNLSVYQTMKRLEGKSIDVVGITGLNDPYRYIKDFCFEFKRKYPHIPLIAGGAFISSQPERILRRVPIDVACTGEGDDIVVELVRRLANRESLEGLHNIAYIKENTLIKTDVRLVENFDRFPFPAYDLLQMDRYLNVRTVEYYAKFFLPISTGRGCSHHCYYCGRPYNKIRRPSPERLLDHMDMLNRCYGVSNFIFYEDSGLYPKEWILKFCRLLIDSSRKYEFSVSGCPEQLDEDLVQHLVQAGCKQISVGVEHWNPEIQKGFYRTTQSKYVTRAWELFRKYGLYNIGFNLLWGHPKDTAKSFMESCIKSLEMLDKYDMPNFWTATLVIYPNSRLLDDALKMEKIIDYEDYMYALGGYGPYVNLTTENDDTYRAIIVEQQMVNDIILAFEELRLTLSIDASMLLEKWQMIVHRHNALKRKLDALVTLKGLLALPLHARNQSRNILESILAVPMYDPHKNYYREIACFKEILELKEGSRLVVYLTEDFDNYNLSKLFNSVRIARVNIAGFVNVNAVEGMFEGYRLAPLNTLSSFRADYLIISDDLQNIGDVMKEIYLCNPLPEITRISKDSFQQKPWSTSGLNSGHYNPKFWKVVMGDNGVAKRLHVSMQTQGRQT